MTNSKKRTSAPIIDRLKLRKQAGARISEESYLYSRVLPALIIFMGVVMVVLIFVAFGVLLGVLG